MTCVACHGTLTQRNWVALSTVTLRECRDCGTLTAAPRPTPESRCTIVRITSIIRISKAQAPDRQHRTGDGGGSSRALDGLAPSAGVRLLDLGCDTGAFLQTASRLYRVQGVGLDVSARAVALAVEQGVQAVCGTVETAPASLGQFDIVTSTNHA